VTLLHYLLLALAILWLIGSALFLICAVLDAILGGGESPPIGQDPG